MTEVENSVYNAAMESSLEGAEGAEGAELFSPDNLVEEEGSEEEYVFHRGGHAVW